ncbi:uncharacterized protein LOC116110254 [Pistacia vera]|uniref:uncharacterized protein LOC116110254 n=1 Tax=Pistacia vera TaxID=55513 RepID=UPI0012639F05|nr:uncharacterized protein LOC116110254 [Pistacia vera]
MGEEMIDKRIVEKVLVSLPERFDSKISSLEDSKDLTQITLTDLVNALQAQEQRRLLRQEDFSEGAMVAGFKGKQGQGGSKRPAREKKGKEGMTNQWNKPTGVREFPPCAHCQKKGHGEKKCWFRPNIQCRECKQYGHIEKIVEDQQPNLDPEQLFVASCFAIQAHNDDWLIDSGCTNHMTTNLEDFVNLDKSYHSKVKVGNMEFVVVKRRGNIVVQSKTSIKLIPNVLYMPNISHNLLSVGQMIEKKYALHFQDQFCTILDSEGNELMRVKMMEKASLLG